MTAKPAKGFTLIELMIVVAVIGVLATLAMYNYNRYGFRARRAEGKAFIAEVAAAQERNLTNYNRYASTVTGAPPGGLGFASDKSKPNGYYSVAISGLGATNTAYTLTATPLLGQAGDVCKNLTLDNFNTKGFTGNQSNGNCW